MRVRPPRGDDRCWNISSMPQIKYINEKKTFSWLFKTSKQTGKRRKRRQGMKYIFCRCCWKQAFGGSCTRLRENNPSAGCTFEANCLRLCMKACLRLKTSFSNLFRLTRRWVDGVISISGTAYAESQLWPRLVCWVRLNETNRGRRPRAPRVNSNRWNVYMGHSPENWTKEGAAFPMK